MRKLYFLAAAIAAITAIVFLTIKLIPAGKGDIPSPPSYSGLTEAAKKQIRQAYNEARKDPVAYNLSKLAVIVHANTLYGKAEEFYLKALEVDSSDWRLHYYLGYLYIELANQEGIIRHMQKAVEINPALEYAKYYLAEAYANTGKNDAATLILKELSKKDNVDPPEGSNMYPLSDFAKYRLARVYMATSQNDSALGILKNLTDQNPQFGPAFRLISTIYSSGGNDVEGEMNLLRANELRPYTYPVDTLIDQLTMLSRTPEYILKQIDISILSNPEWGKKLFDHAFAFIPDNHFLLAKGVRVYVITGETENLAKMLNSHINYFSGDLNELVEVGNLTFRNNLYKVASIYFNKCLQLDPGNFLIKYRLAVCNHKLGNQAESFRILDELSRSHPDSIKVLTTIAAQYIYTGDTDQVFPIIKKLEGIPSGDAEASFLKAKLAISSNDRNKSDQLMLETFGKMPGNVEVIHYIGKLYTDAKQWTKLVTHYEKATRLQPLEPSIIEKLGEIYLNCPDKSVRNAELARYYLERAFYSVKSMDLTRINAGKNLSKLYAGQNKLDKAVRSLSRTLVLAKDRKLPEKEIQEIEDLVSVYNVLLQAKSSVGIR